MEETEGSTVGAWQNLWGRSDYKAVGRKYFYTSSRQQYRTFTIKGTSEAGEAMGMLPTETLSLKVTPNGAVTATLTFRCGSLTISGSTRCTRIFRTVARCSR
jgi:hypothetical protein